MGNTTEINIFWREYEGNPFEDSIRKNKFHTGYFAHVPRIGERIKIYDEDGPTLKVKDVLNKMKYYPMKGKYCQEIDIFCELVEDHVNEYI